MKIFVTGGDGLLGSNLIRELLKRGHELKVLVQPNRQVKTLEGLDIEKVEGDLLDYNQLKKAADGAEAIYHLAANTSIWPSRSDIVKKVNIVGTKNMIRLAKALQIKKMIYVGTANSFSYGQNGNLGKEDTPYISGRYGLDYMDSKYEAQKLVLAAAEEGVPAVVVNPTFMIGPFDSKPSSGAMIVAVYEGKVPGFAPGGRNFICVKDAAVGIANSLEKGKIGECYIIGNKNMSYKEAFEAIAGVLSVKAPNLGLPKVAVLAYGQLSSFFYRLTGKAPNVSFPMAKIACDKHYFSPEKAVRELDLPQSPIEEGIEECFNWLVINGYINKK